MVNGQHWSSYVQLAPRHWETVTPQEAGCWTWDTWDAEALRQSSDSAFVGAFFLGKNEFRRLS